MVGGFQVRGYMNHTAGPVCHVIMHIDGKLLESHSVVWEHEPQRIFPQIVRFGVLSWKKGTRRAGWVARGSELGARGPDGWHADQSWGPRSGGCGMRIRAGSLCGRRSELGVCGPGDTRICGAGPDTKSAGRAPEPDTESETTTQRRARHRKRRAPKQTI